MADADTLVERAADALRRAVAEANNGQRRLLLEEALRLHRLAVAAEKPRSANAGPPEASPSKDED